MLAVYSVSTNELVFTEVRSLSISGREDAAYTNWLDGKSSIIVCSENFKDRDENPPSQQLWPSEILWQSWTIAVEAKHLEPSNLQVIVRSFVVNNPTKRVI